MAGIGDLVVNLKADASKFNREMASAKNSVKSFHGMAIPSFKSIASTAASMITPITAVMTALTAGAIGAGAAIWGLTSRMGEIAGLADKAAQAGTSVKFLQQLTYAADQSGVSAETLTKSLGKLTIAVGNAANGSKPAQEAFGRLGLNIADLQAMRPEDQFLAVAKAISALPTQAERAAASVAVFGKSGLEMTTLFAGGLNDINKLMQDAQAIGIGLNADDVKRVAEADDALQRMKASFGALVDQAIVGLAPTFQEIANTITDWIAPLTKFMDGFNALNDKAGWVSETLQAGMDLAFQHAIVKWDETLATMRSNAVSFSKNMAILFTNPGAMIGAMMGKSAQQEFNVENLNAARDRFNKLMEAPSNAAAQQDASDAAAQQQQLPTPQPTAPNMFQQTIPWLQAAATAGMDIYKKATGSLTAARPQSPSEVQREFRSVPPAFASAAMRGSSEALKTILNSQRPEVKIMTTVAQQAQQQTQLLRQVAQNTVPQFAPEF